MTRSARLRTAIARAEKAGDQDQATEARREYYAEKLAETIKATVDKAPPLRPEQLDRLRRLLATVDGGRVA